MSTDQPVFAPTATQATVPRTRDPLPWPLLGWLWRAQWQAQPGRSLAATLAIAIGVALALAIHLVNQSALAEFDDAMAVINGDAQMQIAARAGTLDEALYAEVAADPAVLASPVIDAVFALADRDNASLRVIGLDVFRAAEVSPALVPSVAGAASAKGGTTSADKEAAATDREPPGGSEENAGSASPLFGDDSIFLSSAALHAFGLRPGDTLHLRAGPQVAVLRVAGTLAGVAGGQQLAVMDIGALQWRLGWLGRLSRIDLRLADGSDRERVRAALVRLLADRALLSDPDAGRQRMSNLSRAYRVNLSVLALVALFTGGFIVYSTLALAVARQQHELALLRVLGAGRGLIVAQVLGQGAAYGAAGAALGSIGGLALAALLLRTIGGDLGGGYFAGGAPALEVSAGAIAVFALSGMLTGLAGAMVPALAQGRLPAARALRSGSLEDSLRSPHRPAVALLCFAAGAALLPMPAIAGLPLPSYLAIAAWLFGGVALAPAVVAAIARPLARWRSGARSGAIAWLAAHRIAGAPASVSATLAGVVAAFALASAMAIMVASFRDSVDRWLDAVLPADAYGRVSAGGAAAPIDPHLAARIAASPGVARAEFQRLVELTLAPTRPPVMLIARPLDAAQPQARLPISGRLLAAPAGETPVYVSEAAADLYGWTPGARIELPLPRRGAASSESAAAPARFFVAGIWRDYARQHGAVAMDLAVYRRLSGEQEVNDVAVWLDGSPEALGRLRDALADVPGLQWRSTGELRALSLRIFDRSFAVTYALEAVAIIVALFGVAAGYAAEGLARVREFGVLRHLGMTRAGIARLFAVEAGLLIGIAVIWGGLLGAAIAQILIHRVNPQSFHWTMQTDWPIAVLTGSALALTLLGVSAATLAARQAMGEAPVRAVREDW